MTTTPPPEPGRPTPPTGPRTGTGWWPSWAPTCPTAGRAGGADAVEAGTIRRYLEPLELGSAIHHDDAAAREYGYQGIVAPFSSLLMYTIPAMWRPGQQALFLSADRDTQPARSPINNAGGGPA